TDHGVHVSGIASAATDNGIGVSAIAFNARLMIVKAGADNDGNSIYRGYEGIKYAADQGAMIINCSWGGFGGGAYGQEIINYALSKGCLIVAAAGNENSDRPEYPAAYPGVISVGNVRSNDVRSTSSSFGPSLDLFAPGSAILSTVNNGTYAAYTGTSMAAPMVSGAAALVKTRFPDLNMQQVGEQLRVTADFIDNLNPGFEGQLGKGRLNVLRAVTEVLPSVRNQKLTVIDKGNGSIPAGDTVQLFLDLKNFLAPATGLVVSLSASNSQIQVLTPQVAVGTIGTLETKTMVGPFKVWVANGIDDNTNVDFRVDYASNLGYTDFEVFSLTVSADYINVLINRVATTFTSNGRVGFSSPDASDGIGFSYKGEDLLFEASLMIGNSPSRVSNNARGSSGAWDEHFVKQVRAHRQNEDAGFFDGQSEFDDSGNPAALNLYIKHRMLSYPSAPDDKYVLVEYDIQNKNSAPLSNVYVGLFTDWDVDDDGRDATRYDAANRMGYTFSKGGALPYAGVKILTPGSPSYYPLSYQVQGDPLQNGGFSLAEKFTTLSSGVKATSLGDDVPSGYDVMHVTGTGPHTIPANGSVRVAFALIGGDDLEDLGNSARAAQAKYQSLILAPPVSAQLELKQNYPNPVRSATTIEFNIPQSGYVDLTLYNILGQRVRTLVNSTLEAGVYRVSPELSDLTNGLYFYKIRF
ncbi:MAG TPA: S8 family serine peptidase, partial [Sphingobacteriaceae bacterium]